jgi:hypothetical protein
VSGEDDREYNRSRTTTFKSIVARRLKAKTVKDTLDYWVDMDEVLEDDENVATYTLTKNNDTSNSLHVSNIGTRNRTGCGFMVSAGEINTLYSLNFIATTTKLNTFNRTINIEITGN